MSQENIAKHFGVSVDTIVDRAKALGLSRDHTLRNKIRHQTNVEKHGEDYSKKKYAKYRETMIDRYGRDNFFSGEDGKEEVREATKKKYGVENIAELESVKQKRRETCMEKYGVDHYGKTEESRMNGSLNALGYSVLPEYRNMLQTRDDVIRVIQETGAKTVTEFSERTGISYTLACVLKRRYKLNEYLPKEVSRFEVELKQILEEISGKEFNKTRKAIYPKEIDLYNDELKFGVEFNGTFWHSVQYEKCEDGVYRLFKSFVREYDPEEVFSYSDIARTRGAMYENLGFKFVKFTQPNYWWINIFSEFYIPRYRTQMPNETQIMTDGGHVKMFDCGSRKWVWNR